jgi:hypothetical protein
MFLACFFYFDHKLTSEQIKAGKVTCNFDLDGYEPLYHTLGNTVYTFAFMGAYVGLYISKGQPNPTANIWSVWEMVNLQLKLLPCWPLMFISEMKLNQFSLP